MIENLKVNSKTSTLEWKRKYNKLIDNATILKPNEVRYIVFVNKFSISSQVGTYFFSNMTLFLKELEEGMSLEDLNAVQILSLALQNSGGYVAVICEFNDGLDTIFKYLNIVGGKRGNEDVVIINQEELTSQDLDECLYTILDLKTGELDYYEV